MKKSIKSQPQIIEELRDGQSMELLKELHILTREGKLNQDTRRKLKQVYHLYQFIEPLLNDVLKSNAAFTLADHGAGKSYLGFILYALFFNLSVKEATTSIDLPDRIDVVTALHACDTATDDAIAFGLAKHAQHMVLVPCCQAEVAGVLRASRGLNLTKTPLAELWRHPLHTREFGSQITNVLRCLQLEASGYNVTVTELVGWEHSMKNELILASQPMTPNSTKAKAAGVRLQQVLDELGLGELQLRFGGKSF